MSKWGRTWKKLSRYLQTKSFPVNILVRSPLQLADWKNCRHVQYKILCNLGQSCRGRVLPHMPQWMVPKHFWHQTLSNLGTQNCYATASRCINMHATMCSRLVLVWNAFCDGGLFYDVSCREGYFKSKMEQKKQKKEIEVKAKEEYVVFQLLHFQSRFLFSTRNEGGISRVFFPCDSGNFGEEKKKKNKYATSLWTSLSVLTNLSPYKTQCETVLYCRNSWPRSQKALSWTCRNWVMAPRGSRSRVCLTSTAK